MSAHRQILLKKAFTCMLLNLVAGSYEHGNEPSSVEGGEFID
jgi:hypothetical protein